MASKFPLFGLNDGVNGGLGELFGPRDGPHGRLRLLVGVLLPNALPGLGSQQFVAPTRHGKIRESSAKCRSQPQPVLVHACGPGIKEPWGCKFFGPSDLLCPVDRPIYYVLDCTFSVQGIKAEHNARAFIEGREVFFLPE